MNIFYVDRDPVVAAQNLVDKHVVKMILESAQLLSTAHRILDGQQIVVESDKGRKNKQWMLGDSRESIMYKATHANHPSAVWCRKTVENYNWLVEHFFGLCEEYTHRYGKKHLTQQKLGYYLQSPPYNLRDFDFVEPPSCMAPEYIVSDDPVENYRYYYKNGKATLHSWTKRNPPDWI